MEFHTYRTKSCIITKVCQTLGARHFGISFQNKGFQWVRWNMVWWIKMTDKCNNVPLLFGISTSHGVKLTKEGNALLKTGSLEKEKKRLSNRPTNKCGMYDKSLRAINIFFLSSYHDNYCKGHFLNIFAICSFSFLYNYLADGWLLFPSSSSLL